MRYTASAAMEDRTLRDVERWKDKIEIRLDNRQVFFLFFGSALVACLLFILGVVVGKRLESRGRAATPEIEDPLALLDRIAATPGAPDDSITFPRALIQAPAGKAGKDKGEGRAKPEAKVVALAPKPDPGATKQEAKAEARADLKAEAKPEPKPEPRTEPKPDTAPTVAAKPAAPEVKAAAAPAPAAPRAVAAKPAPVGTLEKPAAKAPEKTSATSDNDKRGKFTLQLGSFQSKEEADAFMAKFASASPFVVVSDIPDKGRWYRVRVGNFASAEEAMAAKSEFERTHRQIAYVAPR